MERVEFKQTIEPLFEVFRVEPTKTMLLAYYEAIGHLTCQELAIAVNDAIATKTFMPKPFELMEITRRMNFVNIWDAIESGTVSDELLQNKRLS